MSTQFETFDEQMKRYEKGILIKGECWSREPGEKIWWLHTNLIGPRLFSFDKKKIYNMFSDYPNKLTPEEKEIFDKENDYWAEFFKDRPYNRNK